MKKNREFEKTVRNIVWALRRISHIIYVDSRNKAREYGITAPQGNVVKALYKASIPLSFTSLSRELDVTPPNITGIIDRLTEKELARRVQSTDDRRTILVELTDKGRELGKTLPDIIELKLIKGLKDLSPTEIFGIYSALNNIIEIIDSESFVKNRRVQT